MSGECDVCGEHCTDCRCRKTLTAVQNYFLSPEEMNEEVKVWTQMFFNDGSVTQGKYIPRDIFENKEAIIQLAKVFLRETSRKEGVLFIWGAGRTYARRAELFLSRRGSLKGSQTLRLRRL